MASVLLNHLCPATFAAAILMTTHVTSGSYNPSPDGLEIWIVRNGAQRH